MNVVYVMLVCEQFLEFLKLLMFADFTWNIYTVVGEASNKIKIKKTCLNILSS